MTDETATFLGGLAIGIIIAICTWAINDGSWKTEAVEEKHAEWYIDNHIKNWRWKPVVPQIEE